jgi:[ribosomal protein S18]-alanine N-acetyltransferase
MFHFDTADRAEVRGRWMIPRDLPAVTAIERASFPEPWTEDDFRGVLRRRNGVGIVAEVGDAVVGYAVYEMHREYLKVLNLAVAPGWRRRGLGAGLADRIGGEVDGHRRAFADAWVSEANLGALLFFRARGWRAVGFDRDHWPDTPGLAAVLMRLRAG